jgi:hypothetical protein
MHDTVRKVESGDAVMIAFEYGPAQADELDLVAGPVIRQLARQGARVSLVSTRPDGLVAGRAVLRQAIAGDEVLGPSRASGLQEAMEAGIYEPGGQVGVAHLLQASARPELIVVFAGRPGSLRQWIEQVQALPDPPPVVAGTSASSEGVAVAYLSSDPPVLAGVVSGASGAAYYERIADGTTDGPAARRLGALSVGNVTVVLLVIIGAATAGRASASARVRGRR